MNLEAIKQKLRDPTLSITRLADDTGVILDIDGHQVLSFNDVGMEILELLRDTDNSFGEIIMAITNEFEIDQETAEGDTKSFLNKLQELLIDR